MANKSTPPKDTMSSNVDPWWIRGNADTAAFFGVSAQTLSNWESKGCPKDGYGKWDVRKVVDWKYKTSDQSDEARKLRAEADWKQAKAQQEGIKLGELELKYLPVEQVANDLTRVFLSIKKALVGLGRQVSIEIAAIDPAVARQSEKVVNEAVHECLQQLSVDGRYAKTKGK